MPAHLAAGHGVRAAGFLRSSGVRTGLTGDEDGAGIVAVALSAGGAPVPSSEMLASDMASIASSTNFPSSSSKSSGCASSEAWLISGSGHSSSSARSKESTATASSSRIPRSSNSSATAEAAAGQDEQDEAMIDPESQEWDCAGLSSRQSFGEE